jgi:protein-L-isoaspartate(D-aspartate) O-methyltransferase
MKAAVLLVLLACGGDKQAPPPAPASSPPTTTAQEAAPAATNDFTAARNNMVDESIEQRGVRDPRVLAAMRKVKRHELVPADLVLRAYEDNPLPIGFEQTISQPYIVAAMTEAAQLTPGEKVLEIGTGSGYQAAVLAELGGVDVYSIEIVEPLAKRTHELLAKMGYSKLHLRIGDGYKGWPEAAPFDAIIVTAAPPEIPPPLREQLAVGGRLVIPVGETSQELRVIERTATGYVDHPSVLVRFVPMTGRAQKKK